MAKQAASKCAKEMRMGDVGQRLYACWLRTKNKGISKEFADYSGFYKWAMEACYQEGDKLVRHNPQEPFSPDNCVWVPKKLEYRACRDTEREQLWDKTVNRIRIHYGMKPIYSTEVPSG